MSTTSVIEYDSTLENAISKIENLLNGSYVLSKRSIAQLLLQEDPDISDKVKQYDSENYNKISDIVSQTKKLYNNPLNFIISVQRQEKANSIAETYVKKVSEDKRNISAIINKLVINPVTGIPIVLLVIYFGLYKFVGQFGAGTVVDFLENDIFSRYIEPFINRIVETYIPWSVLQDLLAKDYGIFTMALRYAIAIVLPIVGAFFIMFSIIEDSGYLPRLALLVDRIFKRIGLNGRAVIPIVLGFGCDTMATMVSRTLETKRERIIATFLLSLAIPCSAQLGVILALLSGQPLTLIIWIICVILVFLLIGFLASKVLPGERPGFYMELPPLRLPKLTNVLTKTYTRMQWYFLEILPLFVFASILIWIGNITGLFNVLLDILKPVMTFIGLPPEAAETFLFGFFRRDYGAAGLYDLQKAGALSPRQLTVAAVTLTLFIPCIAQFAMTIKERGIKTALAMAGFILPFSFLSGFVLNILLKALGVFA